MDVFAVLQFQEALGDIDQKLENLRLYLAWS